MGLPFGFSKCSRGGGGKPPYCPQWFSIQNAEAARPPPPTPVAGIATGAPTPATAPLPAPKRLGLAGSFGDFIGIVSDTVPPRSPPTPPHATTPHYYPPPPHP